MRNLAQTLLLLIGFFVLISNAEEFSWDLKSQQSYKADDGIHIKISPASDDSSYGKISEHLTVFFLSIENSSDKSVSINFSDFLLSNESNRELLTLHPDAAAGIVAEKTMKKDSFLSNIRIGIGKHVGGGVHVGGSTRLPDISNKEVDNSHIYELAIYPGDIEPKTKLEGLVYFKKVDLRLKTYNFDLAYREKGNPENKKQITFTF